MTVDLSTVRGNGRAKAIIGSGKNVHSILIEGEKGSGRHLFAERLANAFLCVSDSIKPCGKCPACKKYASATHLDMIRLDGSITVKTLRDEYISDIIRYPYEGGKKVYLIDNADLLKRECQNALLKSIEEPPEFAVFILVCLSAQNMLATIRSRCTVLTMTPVDDKAVEQELIARYGSADTERIEKAVTLSDGYVGKAFTEYDRLGSEEYLETEAFMKAVEKRNFRDMLNILSGKKTRDEFRVFISEIRTAYKKAAVAKPSESDDEKKLVALCDALDKIAIYAESNINLSLWTTYTVKEILAATK